LAEAVGQLVDDIHDMAVAFVDVAMSVSIICLWRHIGREYIEKSPAVTVALKRASAVDLPFFVDFKPQPSGQLARKNE
jgi:hypothetical protein